LQGIKPLPQAQAAERGIQITGDFNDRFSFNENADYFSSTDSAKEIIEKGLSEMEKAINKIKDA